jgi:hypothetical protein
VPKTLAMPLATRLSAALRCLFICFVVIYHTVKISEYTHGHMAYWSLISTGDSRCPVVTEIRQVQSLSQPRGLWKLLCNNNTVCGEDIHGGKCGAC